MFNYWGRFFLPRRALLGSVFFAMLVLQGIAYGASVDSLSVTELTAGTGKEIRAGHYVIIHYDAWVYDSGKPDGKGQLFDSSRERGETFTFVYGYKRALPGMEKGMDGMKVGARRLILVPPKLGFDDLKYPYPRDVPTGASLVFDVELLDVVPRGAPNPPNED